MSKEVTAEAAEFEKSLKINYKFNQNKIFQIRSMQIEVQFIRISAYSNSVRLYVCNIKHGTYVISNKIGQQPTILRNPFKIKYKPDSFQNFQN